MDIVVEGGELIFLSSKKNKKGRSKQKVSRGFWLSVRWDISNAELLYLYEECKFPAKGWIYTEIKRRWLEEKNGLLPEVLWRIFEIMPEPLYQLALDEMLERGVV